LDEKQLSALHGERVLGAALFSPGLCL
jgi:hypothetical protein